MKIQDITTKQLTAIEQAMQTAVSRLGIHVTFKAEIRKAYNGEPFIFINSSEFQTFPVLFQSIRVTGEGGAKEYGDGLKLYFHVNYSYDHFGGGHNGCDIGTARFIIHPDGYTQFEGFTLNQ